MNTKNSFKEKNITITPSISNKGMKGDIYVFVNKGFNIDFVNLNQKDVFELPVKKKEHIELHFELQGITDYQSNFYKNIETLSSRFSFFYEPEIDGNLNFIPIRNKRNSVGIELEKEYLQTVFNNEMDILGDFWKNITDKRSNCWINNGFINPELKYILIQLQNCRYDGKLKSIFFKSKINEILANIFHQNRNQNFHYNVIKQDVDKLYYACELINNNFDNPISVNELASKIGMSESKLKRDFTQVFKLTPFQYLLQQRMEKSMKLVLATDLHISEISSIVGYKNPTHFTVAFKKYFDRLPSEFRK